MRRVPFWPLGIVLTLAACSSMPAAPALVEPPPGRAGIRSLAIVVEPWTKAAQVEKPPVGVWQGLGVGARSGATGAAKASAEFAAHMGNSGYVGMLVWGAFSAVSITVGTVGGGLYGAFVAMPEDELARRLRQVEREFAAAPALIALDQALLVTAQTVRPEWRLGRDLAQADATLRVRLVGAGLLGTDGLDPEVAVVVQVETEWVAGAVVHHAEFQYRSPVAAFTWWTTGEGRLLEELGCARRQLAERIAEELLLVEVRR